MLGEVDEYFIEQLRPATLRVRRRGPALRRACARPKPSSRAPPREDPMIPSYNGGKFPLSTHLAERVRGMLADPSDWPGLPPPVANWLELQQERSVIPAPRRGADRNFPARRPALSRRLSVRRAACAPDARHAADAPARPRRRQARSASSPTTTRWRCGDTATFPALIADGRLSLAELFDEDMLGDDLDAWLAESNLMKRTFRLAAVIAGLDRAPPSRARSRPGAR